MIDILTKKEKQKVEEQVQQLNVLPPQEQKNVAQLKKAVMEIVLRNSRATATPEAILGNLIMELQDLLR
jgi:hypothetical protein